MRLFQPITVLVLLSILITPLPCSSEVSTKQLPKDQAYLFHWFSYDSLEPINMRATPLEGDVFGKRTEIRFTSDDGQEVNGLIAFPKNKVSSNKLALVLHPMGSSQNFWWSDKSPLGANKITVGLRERGYTVISLDARMHGERGHESFGPRELLKRAYSNEPRIYIDTIIGSVRDYRIVLNWAKNEFGSDDVLAIGYSMGAQMSLLLASFEPSVNTVVAMVPPFVGSPTSPVAPRVHVDRVTDAKVLWLAGTEDPYSDRDQTLETFNRIGSHDKKLIWFDAGHCLPSEFLNTVTSFFDTLVSESQK